MEIDQLVIAGVGLDRFIRFEVAPYRTTERGRQSNDYSALLQLYFGECIERISNVRQQPGKT